MMPIYIIQCASNLSTMAQMEDLKELIIYQLVLSKEFYFVIGTAYMNALLCTDARGHPTPRMATIAITSLSNDC